MDKFLNKIKPYNGDLINTKSVFANIILWYRRHFVCNLFYVKELKRNYGVANFLKHYLLLILMLIVLLAIPFIAFFCENPDKTTAFELASVVATYISSSLLAVVVYYNSWSQGIREDNKNAILLNAETIPSVQNEAFLWYTAQQVEESFSPKLKGCCGLQPDECNYIHLQFSNMNHHSLAKVNLKKIYFTDSKGNLKELDKYCYISEFDLNKDMLSFGEKKNFFIGLNKSILNTEYLKTNPQLRYFVLFSVSNLDGHKAYCLCENFLHGSDGSYTYSVHLLNCEVYDKLIKMYKVDIIKEFSYHSKINKRWYQRVELYK